MKNRNNGTINGKLERWKNGKTKNLMENWNGGILEI